MKGSRNAGNVTPKKVNAVLPEKYEEKLPFWRFRHRSANTTILKKYLNENFYAVVD